MPSMENTGEESPTEKLDGEEPNDPAFSTFLKDLIMLKADVTRKKREALPYEEELHLIHEAQLGDRDALGKLLESQKGFIINLARDLHATHIRKIMEGNAVEVDDLIQEGLLGVREAVLRFNDQKRVRLMTYAVWYAYRNMADHIKELGFSVYLPKYLFKKDNADNPEIRDTLHMFSKVVSIDGNVEKNREDSSAKHSRGLEDMEAEDRTRTAAENFANEQFVDVLMNRAGLTDREKNIIEKRIMADDPKTLKELGEELSLTKEAVRLIEVKAMTKLRSSTEKLLGGGQ